MKTIVSALIGISFMVCTSHATNVLTGPVYYPGNGHFYYLLAPSTWTAAQAMATNLGGHLATIRNEAENDWVTLTFSEWGGVQRALWIGLNDAAQEGTFVWVSGEQSSYRNWEDGQPDDGGNAYPTEDYVHIWPRGRALGKWNDYIDHDNWFGAPFCGVVEVVPEPSSAALVGLAILGFFLRRRFKR